MFLGNVYTTKHMRDTARRTEILAIREKESGQGRNDTRGQWP
jgi:hypothetical protein